MWHIKLLYFSITFFFTIASINVNATDYVSVSSGNWTTAVNWQGGVAPPTTISSNDNITISSGNTIELSSTLIFNNSSTLTVEGSLITSSNFIVNNTLTLTIFGKLVVDGNFQTDNNYTTTINGDLLVTGDFDVNSTSSLDLDGSITVYGDLTGANTNVITGDGEVNVKGSLSGLNTTGYSGSVNDGFVANVGLSNNGCYIKAGSNAVIYIDGGSQGSFNSLFESGSDGMISSDGQIIIEGDWKNYTTDYVFDNRNTSGTIEFVGSASQNIGGSKATYFENMEVNNSNGVTINDNILISNNLNFVSGSITTGSTDTLIIKNTSTSAITNQASGRSVIGNLQRYMSVASYVFPLSEGDDYLPATLNITNLGSMTYLSSKFTASSSETVPLGLNVGGTPITEFLDKGYWTFTPDNGTGVQYDITVTSQGHTNGGDNPEQHAVFKRNGVGDWASVGTHDNSTQSGSGSAAITATRTVLISFSDFIIGRSSSNPLPIVLKRFDAVCATNSVELWWETLIEFRNDFFTIEYSTNGTDYSTIAQILGAGTSYHENIYSYVHKNRVSSPVYYRLSQTDYNGTVKSYPEISVQCSSNFNEDITIEKISKDEISFSFSKNTTEPFKVFLSDQLGRIIFIKEMESIMGYNWHTITLPQIETGVYIFYVAFRHQRFSSKIIIE